MAKKQTFLSTDNKHPLLPQLDVAIMRKKRQIKVLSDKFADGKNSEWMKDYFTGKAFVTFQRSQEAKDILQ